MRERLVVSVSGKGGVGKTTIASLLVRTIIDNTSCSLLVVDADPVLNLPRTLGINVHMTVGQIASNLRKKIDEGSLPVAVTKQDILEGDIFEAIVEGDTFDFLAMGRSEGEGCYCYVNRLLTHILDTLTKNYDITLLDMSAGLEHFSRRTDRNVDFLVIVIDPSKMAFEAAVRIMELAKEVHIDFKKVGVIANRFPLEMETDLRDRLAEKELTLWGMIPNDEEVAKINYNGQPLLKISTESKAAQAIGKVAEHLGLLSEKTLLEFLGQSN
jgi:CO dehydrogenase maturation factor